MDFAGSSKNVLLGGRYAEDRRIALLLGRVSRAPQPPPASSWPALSTSSLGTKCERANAVVKDLWAAVIDSPSRSITLKASPQQLGLF